MFISMVFPRVIPTDSEWSNNDIKLVHYYSTFVFNLLDRSRSAGARRR